MTSVISSRVSLSVSCPGKYVPESAVSEMKSNYTLPQDSDPYIDKIIWVDLNREPAQALVDM